jgi:hypothetical protein
VRHGRSVAAWKTKPISWFSRAAFGGRPPTAMAPSEGAKTSAMSRSSVDFPQPDGPISAAKLPSGTLRSMPSSAVRLRPSRSKRLVTPRMSIPVMGVVPVRCPGRRELPVAAAAVVIGERGLQRF